MTRTAVVIGLVATASIAFSAGQDSSGIERFPDTLSLNAKFPSKHQYVIEVWKDKATGSFKAKVFDLSIPRDYDRQSWEKFRTEKNAPGSGSVSRKVEFTTMAGVQATEREQITEKVKAIIKEEASRIQFVMPKQIDVKVGLSDSNKPTEASTSKKADNKAGTLVMDESAKKLTGTKWNLTFTPSPNVPTAMEFRDKGVFVYVFDNRPSNDGTWKVTGKTVNMRIGHMEFTGTIAADNTIEGTCQIFSQDGNLLGKSDWKATRQN
jgi:hypothetical protein